MNDTLKLKYPVESAGETIETLTMRRPKASDSRDAQRGLRGPATPADMEIRLFANLCEVAPETIEALDMYDYTRLQEIYQGFLEG